MDYERRTNLLYCTYLAFRIGEKMIPLGWYLVFSTSPEVKLVIKTAWPSWPVKIELRGCFGLIMRYDLVTFEPQNPVTIYQSSHLRV